MNHHFFVYILQSTTTGQFYVGSCINIIRQFNEHQSGYSMETRGRGPWWMPYYEIYDSEAAAGERVSEIRKKKSSRFIKTLIYSAFPLMELVEL